MKMRARVTMTLAVMTLADLSAVRAENAAHQVRVPAARPMDATPMESMDHATMAVASDMTGMVQSAAQSKSSQAATRDTHAYADGYNFGSIPRPRLADEHDFGSLIADWLESARTSDNTAIAYDLQAWYGCG